MYQITEEELKLLNYDLDKEIARYSEAREAFKNTENAPAPASTALVEEIVRRHNGEYEVVVPKVYVRIVDNVILDKRKILAPLNSEWTEVVSEEQQIGNVWDADSNQWIKPAYRQSKVAIIQEDIVNANLAVDVLKKKVVDLEIRNNELDVINGRINELSANMAILERRVKDLEGSTISI